MRLQAHTTLGQKTTHMRGFFSTSSCPECKKQARQSIQELIPYQGKASCGVRLSAALFYFNTSSCLFLFQFTCSVERT
jgi:hypothetical protein